MLRRDFSASPGLSLPGVTGLAFMIAIAIAANPGACTSPRPPPATESVAHQPPGEEPPAHHGAPAGSRDIEEYEAHFILGWRGARIGDASEWVGPHDGGLRFIREERIALRRGQAVVPMVTRITIDMAADLAPHRLAISQISGPNERRGRATRTADGERWSVRYDGEATRELPGDAMPAELVPLRLLAQQRRYNRGDRAFSGPVLLAGYGFALAQMDVVADDAREFDVTVRSRGPAGPGGRDAVMRGRWRTTRYGSLAAVQSAQGVSARRVHPSELAAPFDAPELVDSASMPLVGTASTRRAPTALIIEPVARDAPPDLPGQRISVRGDSWQVELAPGDVFAPSGSALAAHTAPARNVRPSAEEREWLVLADDIVQRADARSARAEIAALARATDVLLDDDLGAPATHARAALALGRGDCTAHATVFYELARARGIPVLLVTGYRMDIDRLVRHRWALASVDGAWMAVDPTYGEAPATPGLLGLATHHASSAELSLVDETAFAGLADAHARVGYRSEK